MERGFFAILPDLAAPDLAVTVSVDEHSQEIYAGATQAVFPVSKHRSGPDGKVRQCLTLAGDRAASARALNEVDQGTSRR